MIIFSISRFFLEKKMRIKLLSSNKASHRLRVVSNSSLSELMLEPCAVSMMCSPITTDIVLAKTDC